MEYQAQMLIVMITYMVFIIILGFYQGRKVKTGTDFAIADRKLPGWVAALSERATGESSWALKHGSDYWIYPDWKTDLTSKKDELVKAGYTRFIHIEEKIPEKIQLKKRPGKWNWDLKLL